MKPRITWLFIALFCGTVANAAIINVNGVYWCCAEVDGGVSIVDDQIDGPAVAPTIAGDVVVPAELNGLPVVEIGRKAFSGCSRITSLVIPESVKAVGFGAFVGCSSMTNIVLPVCSISERGYQGGVNLSQNFSGCTSLIRITGPAPTTLQNAYPEVYEQLEEFTAIDSWIAGGTFINCQNLRRIVFAEGVETIADSACLDCRGLSSVVFPRTLTHIGRKAFSGCSSLSVVDIPDGIVSVGKDAFYGTPAAALARDGNWTVLGGCLLSYDGVAEDTLSIPDGVEIICSYAFPSNRSLHHVVFPPSLRIIGDHAFDTTGLVDISFPSGLERIGDGAFRNCGGLEAAEIPSSVTYVGAEAFEGCALLTDVGGMDGVTFVGYRAFANCSALHTFDIRSEAVVIEPQALSGCVGLKTLTLPVTARFSEMYGDTTGKYPIEVRLVGSADSIPAGAFTKCSSVVAVMCPPTVKAIGGNAFSRSGLKRMSLPESIEVIAAGAFSGCADLEEIDVPAALLTIGENAFNGCVALKSIGPLPNLKVLGQKAFDGCSALETIDLPPSVDSVFGNTFAHCASLRSVNIDSSSYYTYEGAVFSRSGKLVCCPGGKSELVIPDGIRDFEGGAFAYTGKLVSIYFVGAPLCEQGRMIALDQASGARYCYSRNELRTEWDDYYYRPGSAGVYRSISMSFSTWSPKICTCTFDSRIQGVPDLLVTEVVGQQHLFPVSPTRQDSEFDGWWTEAFGGVRVLATDVVEDRRAMKLYARWKILPSGSSAYSDGSGLTSVMIPSGVTSIGDYEFSGCSGLTSVTIPSGVTSIGNGAFCYCSGLTSVTIPSSVTSVGYWAFYGCERLTTIYVEGDADRVRGLLTRSDFDVSRIAFEDVGPSRDFSGESKQTFNGFVRGTDGMMCGMVQIATAKVTKKGEVKVSGFVMLEDGKKQALKAVSGKIENGLLTVATTCGKLGNLTLTIGGDGFVGSLGTMSVASETTDERLGVFKGALTLSYFDAKTGKVKTKKIAVGGVASGDEVVGTLTIKGQTGREFVVEIGE